MHVLIDEFVAWSVMIRGHVNTALHHQSSRFAMVALVVNVVFALAKLFDPAHTEGLAGMVFVLDAIILAYAIALAAIAAVRGIWHAIRGVVD